MLESNKYSADITAGSLLLSETKTVVGLLLERKNFKEIGKLVETQNILQKRSVASSTRIYSLVKHRLENFDKDLWSLIYYGDSDTSRLAALIASVKNSRILGDFMLFALREKYQLFEKEITKTSWVKFIQDCKLNNPDMPVWTDNTIKKIGDCVFRILAETGYINSTSKGILQKVYIPIEIKNFLQNHHETYVQKCIEVDFFADKIKDELYLGEIRKAVAHDTDVVLFNIDSKAQQDKTSDAILAVFQSVFNEKLGYSKTYPYIAEIERFLDNSGKFDAFKQECMSNEFNWDTDKDSFSFYMDAFKQALSKVLGQSESDCEKLIDTYKSSPNLTVEGFAGKVNDYLKQHKGKRIIFLVDEIGQFIGQDTKLMLNLQTITENLGTICKGKAWIVVTSQQEVDSIIGDLTASKANDFSKITGRFNLRLALSSANTDEVIKKRLLKKTQEATCELNALYEKKGDIIKSQTTFSDMTKTYKQFKSADDFAESYLPSDRSIYHWVFLCPFLGVDRRKIT